MTLTDGSMPPKKTILVDLGGIFVHPPENYKLKTGDAEVAFGRILSSSIWMDYEMGKNTEKDCFLQVADLFGVQLEELKQLVYKLRQTLTYDTEMLSVFRAIKQHPGVEIALVTNISEPEYQALRGRWDDTFWSTFDHIFTSWQLGVRKPSLPFYRHVLRAMRAVPQRSFIVDDRPENVLAALSLGLHGTVGTVGISSVLTNFIGDPVERGTAFLRRNAKTLYSTTEDGVSINENYGQLLILEAMKDWSLVDLRPPPRLWNFFSGKPQYTSKTYPDDMDTTALALIAMDYEPELANEIIDEMLNYVDEDGLVQIYTDKFRPRVDAIIALNVLVACHKYGRGYELPRTHDWIRQILLNRAYVYGTRYYPSPEWFLYYMSRLVTYSSDPSVKDTFEGPLKTRLIERIGVEGDSFSLATRLLACHLVGVENHPDRERLASLQQEDGGWEQSAMYIFPTDKKTIGNRGVTTALAVRALRHTL